MSAQPELFGARPPPTDQQETREWMDALSAVIDKPKGPERAHFLLEQLLEHARQSSIDMPFSANTGYVNTIEPDQEERCPGNIEIEGAPARLHALERHGHGGQGQPHNPADGGDLGGHIGSFASLATCSAPASTTSGTPRARATAATCSTSRATVSPGIYARAYLEGRLTEEQLLNFRQEVDGKGLSSYPHPKLMPEFWQFPTVSMGLGPLMAIYQARFLKYLHARGIANTENRKVWVFCGDGEMDEPEAWAPSAWPRARSSTTCLRHQLQPAAPGRPGARQRQDHPGARRRVPRLGLERHQAALGQRLGPAAGARQGRASCASS
jgi:pyruvate dehydrogenase E1 component